jgi:hypothetical protein
VWLFSSLYSSCLGCICCSVFLLQLQPIFVSSEAKTPGVKEATHDKNDEIVKCETTISGFQIPGVGGVKDTHDKNVEIAKCETMT